MDTATIRSRQTFIVTWSIMLRSFLRRRCVSALSTAFTALLKLPIKRDKALNPNEWWTIFDDAVSKFNFAFVSGKFTGGFKDRLENISRRSHANGAAINSVNLLLLAEEIKSGRLTYGDAMAKFECNDEIQI